jgi:hypothetical protein
LVKSTNKVEQTRSHQKGPAKIADLLNIKHNS